ncbi:MAG TPA: hypothetical protein VHV32_19130 [Candidatus Angelobacter sp.]|nr:hypothetical protein [Candidatus Angelobacter sp.]
MRCQGLGDQELPTKDGWRLANLEAQLRARRKDANHEVIADHLRSLGWSVLDLSSMGRGIPDMAIGKPGIAILVEVKNPNGKGIELTPDERRVKDNWEGPYLIVTSAEDAERQLTERMFGR